MLADTISCRLCEARFKRISQAHLDKHGWTLEQYQEQGWPTTPNQERRRVRVDFEGEGKNQLIQAILDEPQYLQRMSEGIAADQIVRESKLRTLATMHNMLRGKLQSLQGSVELKAEVLEELRQEWRLKYGGEDGSETPTADLLAVFRALLEDEKSAADLLAKYVATLSSDGKQTQTNIQINQQVEPRFTGELQTFKDVRPQNREAMRLLLEKVRSRHINAGNADAHLSKDAVVDTSATERDNARTGAEGPAS